MFHLLQVEVYSRKLPENNQKIINALSFSLLSYSNILHCQEEKIHHQSIVFVKFSFLRIDQNRLEVDHGETSLYMKHKT